MDISIILIFLIIILMASVLAPIILWVRNRPSLEFQIEDIALCLDDLTSHAESLAKSQVFGKKKRALSKVKHRIDTNYKSILNAYEKFNHDFSVAFPIPPAAEWLLDNFYIIEEQKNIIIKELSESIQPLPVITKGTYAGFPRIFAIAVEIVSHVDGNANEKVIKDFINAYQRYSFLSIDELWMLTLMVKAALMEKLFIVCNKMCSTRQDWYRSERIADQIIQSDSDCEKFKDYIKTIEELTPSFVEHLIKKLRKSGSKTLWMIDCLDSVLAQRSTTTDELICNDHYNQATTQVSIGNVINSFRALSSFDATALFSSLSEVERILNQDPCGVYPNMDFNSRDHYRNVVAKLARKYDTTEINIARISYQLAKESYELDADQSPDNHVGYYLVDSGRKILAGNVGKTGSKPLSLMDFIKSNSVQVYVYSVLILSFLIALFALTHSRLPIGAGIIVFVVGMIPASEIVITIINTTIGRFIPPSKLPKLELKDGIPESMATMVIVPTLVPNVSRTLSLIDNLEVFYLANRGKNLYFALVGDFKDSVDEKLPEDQSIIDAAIKRIDHLNKKYCTDQSPIFFFYCRERRYNEKQNKWMGWERKRGAIIEFNRLLRRESETSYTYFSFDPSNLPNIKYVITIDADTQLPLETARQLIGTISHPLNKAVFDAKTRKVTNGYGILQPRINVSIDSASVSYFTKVFAGQGGIDPYTTTVSDVYQDAFGEGIFTGKGIYDIDIFQMALNDTIPENTVLSHDLLEGSYLRCGLVTDVELLDGYPSKYNSFMMRLHRWTRGDWQLLPWIFGRDGLSMLSRWKMADNLRRSLLYPSIIVIFLVAVAGGNYNSTAWTWLSVLALCSPVISYIINIILAGDYKVYIMKRSATVMTGFKAIAIQLGLIFTFIPYQAAIMGNAIIKTINRVLFTKRNLIEWVTAADMELALKNNLSSYYRRMWFSPVYGLVCLLVSAYFNNVYVGICAVTFIIWSLAPLVAYTISKPASTHKNDLSEENINELRLLARKTWCYFDEFAGPEENFLPADNFQLDPFKGAAHRTSPTNIGLLLVSNLAARDMGYISSIGLVNRISNTVDTIEKLAKWQGHLFNWYNTTNLNVLQPKFISTVDSGNFAGYLMVLRVGLEEYRNKPLYDDTVLDGLFDLLKLCNIEINNDSEFFDTDILKKLTLADEPEERYKKLINELQLRMSQLEDVNKTGYWLKKLSEFLDEYNSEFQKYGSGLFDKLSAISDMNLKVVDLENRVQALIDNMHFRNLFNRDRNLFTIGFDVEEGHATKSCYDLFASEARQTSLIAIAKGEIGKQHWFKMGRKLVKVNKSKGLVSWTGTMFEYLMPKLLIKSYPNTLIGKTYDFVVKSQIKYGKARNIPWGISESCFYMFDIALNYQYKAFGVPQLGLKRGLANDYVVSPYSTVMAIDIAPQECMENIRKLRSIGAEGDFGFYEAVDFSEARLQQDEKFALVKSYMVHHQGMSMLALVNFFKENIMQTRFHRDPSIKATEILIQEKFPAAATLSKEFMEQPVFFKKRQANAEEAVIREYKNAGIYPNMHILSNGSYLVMLTDKGNGYGKLDSTALYRWINDYMQTSGAFIFVRNINSNEYWSTTFSPVNTEPEAYKVIFSPHKAEYIRREGNIETNTEVIISSEDNTEIRRVSIHNHSNSNRIIELTSYMEVVLSNPEADTAHPAFNKLFVKTEFVERYNGLLAVRRKRDDTKQTIWGYHVVSAEGNIQGNVEYETDRARFIGRNKNINAPLVMEPDEPLSNSIGSVLDPIFSLRIKLCIEAGKTAVVNFTTGICDTRDMAVDMLEKYNDPSSAYRVLEMAWTRSIVEAGFINVSTKDEREYLKLMPQLIYGIDRNEQSEYILSNKLGQSGLWSFGISGDLPIVLVTVKSRDSFEEIQWVLKLHNYYRIKGIIFDLVILIVDEESYTQPLFDMIRDLAASGNACEQLDKRGGVFIRNSRQMDQQHKDLLFACAKIIFDADMGIAPLIERIERSEKAINSISNTEIFTDLPDTGQLVPEAKTAEVELESGKLQFFNGFGGFNDAGNEYVILLKNGKNTPMPWVNVIANNKFGFLCTESGGGYTWYLNSSQNKLTTWINDPVTDTPSEILYMHEVKSGAVWSLTPSPIREKEGYIVCHGFGYTTFKHTSHGLSQNLTQFCAHEDSVKISIISLKNITGEAKEVDLAYYLRPVMGTDPNHTSPYIVTEFNNELGSVLINNVYSSDFREFTAYLSCSEKNITYTGQRLEFISSDFDLKRPQGMIVELKGTVGAGYDACAVNKTRLNILPDETRQIVFLLGQDTIENARATINKFRKVQNAHDEFIRVKESWSNRLQQIQISTPDNSMNIILNGWLQYQALSCRILARTGYYQAGGAFGFRDQLQDVMSVVYTMPEITKNQILIHCRHQFVEGDVQHWWHDQKTNGIRTRYSDDLLWLPYVTCDYINVTGDYDILNIEEQYLESPLLGENEHERYEIPGISDTRGSVYQHCIKAIDRGLKYGVHGIPLMGGGDWNDGMNLVGVHGRGESVWLGWFLYCVLKRMIPICQYMGDAEKAAAYEASAIAIIEAIEKEAWDGSWYRRAYFDDGTPLGSIQNDEAKIDSLSQSWAAITGAAKRSRTEEAMGAVEKYLVDRKNGLIKLLTPPFYEGTLNPGYIKGYLPGVRENGGQYTHAATWVIYAFSQLGDGDKTWELFSMINPINHSRTNMECMTYKVEPYALAADVYSVYPNEGRGGWTWYTGAAGWMYRIGIEQLLGLKKQGNHLFIDPCLPESVNEYSVIYRFGKTVYNIKIKNISHKNKGELINNKIEMIDDGKAHEIEVIL